MIYQDIQESLSRYKADLQAMKVLQTIAQPQLTDRRNAYKHKIPPTGRKAKYPWGISPGRSFLVPCAPNAYDRMRVMNSLTSCINNQRRKTGFNYAQRSDPKGVRVWRVE